MDSGNSVAGACEEENESVKTLPTPNKIETKYFL